MSFDRRPVASGHDLQAYRNSSFPAFDREPHFAERRVGRRVRLSVSAREGIHFVTALWCPGAEIVEADDQVAAIARNKQCCGAGPQ
jgi:hypothetical protein